MPKIRRRLTGVCGNETGSDMDYNRLYSGEPMIAEVVEFTILEALIDAEDPNILRECLKYMGEETKAALNNIGKWFNKDIE